MPERTHPRDHRVDFLRGIALVMIFINHIPGTLWENVTSRNFGFSDAAEGFVLMSGIATGLAYGPAFLRGVRPGEAMRPWRRALTLWWVHVLVVFAILALFILMSGHPAVAELAEKRAISRALEDPAGMIAPLALLGHHFAYADILPLYVVLMISAPVLLALAVRWPRALIAGSLVLWFIAGLLRVNLPAWPSDARWLFNPFSWQVLFVAGILIGLATRQGRRWLPVRVWPLRLAWAFVILAAVWVQVPAVGALGGHLLWLLGEHAGLPPVLTSFSKPYLHLPRLLHILALAYVLSALPPLTRAAASSGAAWLRMLGRHSLPVFATGTVLAYGAQVVKAVSAPSFLLDTALIVAGLGLLLLVAILSARGRERRPLVAAAPPQGALELPR